MAPRLRTRAATALELESRAARGCCPWVNAGVIGRRLPTNRLTARRKADPCLHSGYRGSPHWLRLIASLPFDVSTAQRLVKIGSPDAQKLFEVAHGPPQEVLPPSWRTLYELTKLSREQFEDGLAAGIIRPDRERKDVATILRKPKGDEHALTVVPRAGRFHLIQAAVDALDDGTVDAIITDPPYPREYLPVTGRPVSAPRRAALASSAARSFIAARSVANTGEGRHGWPQPALSPLSRRERPGKSRMKVGSGGGGAELFPVCLTEASGKSAAAIGGGPAGGGAGGD